MLKVLIVLILITYVFFKIGSFLFNIFFGGLKGGGYTYQHQTRQAAGDDLNIDSVPRPKTNSRRHGYKGGEYVDYEEVD